MTGHKGSPSRSQGSNVILDRNYTLSAQFMVKLILAANGGAHGDMRPYRDPYLPPYSPARVTYCAMIVLDASATVDWLLQTPAGQRIEERIYARKDTLHTVHLLDVEVAQVLRRLVREGTLARKRAEEAMEDLIAVRVTRYAPVLLLNRIWQLRQNLSAYDAAYVALAEELEAPLITRDQRIAAAPVHAATVEVF
jgi:predicted nucleic acid-binding protein